MYRNGVTAVSKIKEKLKKFIPSKRKLIQLYSALLFNANIEGFFKGTISKGSLKGICTPGLNCYSCPGASGACPLGSLQNALNGSEKRTPYYVIGIILLYGILLGRFICGFLCPFGLIQELLHKIKTPKLKKNKFTKIFSYFKYVILVFLVIIVPILYGFRNTPLPGFCKYICPAGTLEGAMGYLSHIVNESEISALGPLFTWKFALLVSFILGSIFIFRFFCRFFCPLGALYGLFNKISVFGIKLECHNCTDCGLCKAKCKMDISHVGDHECISCGECIDVCPTKAIRWKGSKIFLPENEIPEKNGTAEISENEKSKAKQKAENKRLAVKITAGVLMLALLVGTLVYHNFIDVDGKETAGISFVPIQMGDLSPNVDIKLFDENGETGESFNPAKSEKKLTVVNFWGTWCSGCVHELPWFKNLADAYKDEIDVIAIHTVLDYEDANGGAPAWLEKEGYADTAMLFGKDVPLAEGSNEDLYFKMFGGKSSYPITVFIYEGKVSVMKMSAFSSEEELFSEAEFWLED